MRGRSFLFLVIVAAALGGYIYFVELKREPEPTTPTTREKVFTLEPGAIERLEVINASAEATALERKDTTWQVTAPESAEADTIEVSQVVSSIETLERSRVIDENPSALAPFGLEPARIRVSFTPKGAAAPTTLLIGNKTPTGGDLYAKVADQPKVFLIAAYLEETFNKGPFGFREKTVLRFTRDAADTLTIAAGANSLAFKKRGDEWHLTAPVAGRADFSAVDGIIGRLFQAKMTGFVATDGTARLKEFGLDRPQMKVSIVAGSATAELLIGAKDKDHEDRLYARDGSRPMIFTVEKTLLDDLTRKADDLRMKDLFEFRSFSAVSLDLTWGGVTYKFSKKPGEGENPVDTWSLTAPSAKTVDAAKMTDLLTTLSNLRAESFAAKAHTSGDTLGVTARFGDATTPQVEQVTFRKSGTTVHGTREGDAGGAVVSTVDFDKVVSLLKELAGAK